jgi:hypothetical protein
MDSLSLKKLKLLLVIQCVLNAVAIAMISLEQYLLCVVVALQSYPWITMETAYHVVYMGLIFLGMPVGCFLTK